MHTYIHTYIHEEEEAGEDDDHRALESDDFEMSDFHSMRSESNFAGSRGLDLGSRALRIEGLGL